jgi:hypothetical protein
MQVDLYRELRVELVRLMYIGMVVIRRLEGLFRAM